MQGVGRALHVVGRLLQGVRRRSGAVEDVARLAEVVGGGSGAGRGGRGGGKAGGGRVWSGRAAGKDVPELWERRDCVRKVANVLE